MSDRNDGAPSPASRPRGVPQWLTILFPRAPEPSEAGSRRVRIGRMVATLGLVAAGVLLTILRQRGVPATNSLFAEDGEHFISLAAVHGPLWAAIQPSGGYLSLWPGLLAGATVATLSPYWWAAAVAVEAALTTTLLSLVVYHATSGHVRHRWVRAFIALCVLLPPVGDSDLANDLNNLHWYLVFAAFWCLLWRPRTFGARVAGSVVVFFAVASDGSALLLLPLVLGRYIALRGADAGAGAKSLRSGRRRLLRPAAELGPVVAFAAGAVLQVLLRGGPGSTVDFTATIAGLARTFAVRILLGGIAGPPLTARAWQAGGWWLVSLSALVVLVVLISGALPAETRPLVLLMLVCSLVWFVAPDVVRGNDPIWSVGRSLDSGKRYAAIPSWFLAAIVAVSLDNAMTRLRRARSWRRLVPAGAVPALACLGILAGLVTSYSAHNLRQYGPVWTAQVSEAAQDCRSDHTALVTVPIAPEISARPWVTRIPCSDGRLR